MISSKNTRRWFINGVKAMKIDRSDRVNGADRTRAASRISDKQTTKLGSSSTQGVSDSASRPDTLSISTQAETISRLAARIAELPDIRQERVASLREAIAAGASFSASDIADSIIRNESLI